MDTIKKLTFYLNEITLGKKICRQRIIVFITAETIQVKKNKNYSICLVVFIWWWAAKGKLLLPFMTNGDGGGEEKEKKNGEKFQERNRSRGNKLAEWKENKQRIVKIWYFLCKLICLRGHSKSLVSTRNLLQAHFFYERQRAEKASKRKQNKTHTHTKKKTDRINL